ncbi:MAG: hypothetical protein INF18_15700 [Methylobacterium sp.]|nr:hypothetical protein [Methylobacterium sp.]MCA3638881.1 hypothetical protein [Methylobacterium sp.]
MVSPGNEEGQDVADGRVGLTIAIEHFVVAPDRSLGARLERWHRWSLWRWKRGRVRLLRASRRVVGQVGLLGLPAILAAILKSGAFLRGIFRALHDSAVLLTVILRYAMNNPLQGSKVEQHRAWRPRKSSLVLALGLPALALSLFLSNPERAAFTGEPLLTAAEARMQEPAPEPASLETRRNPEPVLLPEPRPWQPVRQPMALYNLESPELSGLALTYRVSQRGSLRQDMLIWQPRQDAGESETRRSGALVVIERHDGVLTEKPLFSDLAARAAEHRLVVERMARPQDIRTKFGLMEAAEVKLRQDKAVMPCLAYRRIDMAGVSILGWLCGTIQRPVDRVSMACFLDRLDLVGGGRDASLRKLFAEAERSRQNCISSRQPGRRLTWMDHEASIPALKLTARR